jgi:hypothetical protein
VGVGKGRVGVGKGRVGVGRGRVGVGRGRVRVGRGIGALSNNSNVSIHDVYCLAIKAMSYRDVKDMDEYPLSVAGYI